MDIPFVIDNRKHKLADVLNDVLARFENRSLDVATAYFTVSGFELLRGGLSRIGSFRLLLGTEPLAGEDLGLRPDAKAFRLDFQKSVEVLPFTERTLRAVEELIAFLMRDAVSVRVTENGFLHAKCYLVYGDKPDGQAFLFDRFQPVIGIVGSSNFTGPGLTSNRELNLAHRVLMSPEEAEDKNALGMVQFLSDEQASSRITVKNRQLLKSEVGARAIMELVEWYDRAWGEAREYKSELIELLDASKFGKKTYTPYQVYMKALYEYFKDDLEPGGGVKPRGTAVELAEFQEDAVRKARKILAIYNGVMIADSVGLGKTWIGKRLLEDYAYHLRQKALIVCPASLRDMWQAELTSASIAAMFVSQEEMGREDFCVANYGDADVLLVDESHNFRNAAPRRYENLEAVIGRNGGRGRSGERKKIILLTATPISNDILDLYNQINLIAQGDAAFFSAIGIGDLRKYFMRARREKTDRESTVALFNLLEEVVVRRTRPFIQKAYPDATIRGKKIKFPERRLKSIRYDLEQTYQGIYADVVAAIENLKLAPYNLESFKKDESAKDIWEEGRQEALVGIFKSRFLKRFESSVYAFRVSVKRALQFQKTFEAYLLDGKLLDCSDFRKALQFLAAEDIEDDCTPVSLAERLDENREAKAFLDALPSIQIAEYDLKRLHGALQQDIEALQHIWGQVKEIDSEEDTKVQAVKDLLEKELKGRKVLIFSYYKDTARYLERVLKSEALASWRQRIGDPVIRRMDSGNHPHERTAIVKEFAPRSNDSAEIAGTDREIDILITTDVLSEGQNLQDCGFLLNYDLHWNPTRMVQRAGRVDRLGSLHDEICICNMFPDDGLEQLLRIVERLSQKIGDIDRAGFLDASILGEQVHPKNFGTLRRILGEDGSVLEEEEQFVELASNEFLQQQVRDLILSKGEDELSQLPDGIHSGLARLGARGMFFYFKADNPEGQGVLHFWKYFDAKTERIYDNRHLIANLIACQPDTPRVIGDLDAFNIHDRIVASILQSDKEQVALEEAPRRIDPVQQQIVTILEGYLTNPRYKRRQLLDLIKFVGSPKSGAQIKALKKALAQFAAPETAQAAVDEIARLKDTYGASCADGQACTRRPIKPEELRLVCFDYISGG
jgi:superfamily II DNA or RNA helicase